MRYKHYLRIIKDHVRMQLHSPLILFDVSYNSDTYRRILRYISSHRFSCPVQVFTREFDGYSIPLDYSDDPLAEPYWA